MSHTFPSRWKAYKLDQLGFVGRGRSRHRPRNEPSLYGGEYPFFQTGDVKAANLYLSEYSQTYSEKGLAQSKQWEAGTLCITIAANIADTAILGTRGCFPDSVIGFIGDPAETDVRFIKYYIDLIKLDMQQVSHGTTQDNLSLDKLLHFDFVVPHVEEQRKIASILSAYDDLIENNLRRIKILEEMAQNLYREWFVKFRFPGHQHARFTDSPLGRIPEGWEVKALGDLVNLRRKGVQPQKFPDEVFEHFSFPAYDSGKLPLEERGLSIKSGKYEVPPDCVLIPKLNPHIPRTWLPKPSRTLRSIASTEYLILEPTKHSTAFYYVIFSSQEMIQTLTARADGTSTSHKRLKPADFMKRLIVSPPTLIVYAFDALVVPATKLVSSLIARNTALRRTRDLLLPRLISGEVDVSELDIAVPEEGEARTELCESMA